MSVTWTPPPGPLFMLPETAKLIAYDITATVDIPEQPGPGTPATITGYDASITPAQPVIDVATSGAGVHVSAQGLSGLFDIDCIEYRQDDQIHRVDDWDEVPAAAPYVIVYKPSAQASKTYTLNATAHLSDSTDATAAFDMTITQDWSAGRQRLVAEINARRH